jgi:hypothetical protein
MLSTRSLRNWRREQKAHSHTHPELYEDKWHALENRVFDLLDAGQPLTISAEGKKLRAAAGQRAALAGRASKDSADAPPQSGRGSDALLVRGAGSSRGLLSLIWAKSRLRHRSIQTRHSIDSLARRVSCCNL